MVGDGTRIFEKPTSGDDAVRTLRFGMPLTEEEETNQRSTEGPKPFPQTCIWL